VRIDFVGGTLDLEPINLILPNVVTLNGATDLYAEATVSESREQGVEINSLDYKLVKKFDKESFSREKLSSGFFGSLRLVAEILFHLKVTTNVKVELTSGAPAGSGLGGSSTMGVTLYRALLDYLNIQEKPEEIVKIVRGLEAKILDRGPAGYQDYYPAMYGGLLALHADVTGVKVEQLFDENFVHEVEKRLTLVFSGLSRNSGINNWEVYKGFFDKPNMRKGLSEIANISFKAYQALKESDVENFCNLIAEEGRIRSELFENIVPSEMEEHYKKLKEEVPLIGLKACGAGGGGCFLFIHTPENKKCVQEYFDLSEMTILPFKVVTL